MPASTEPTPRELNMWQANAALGDESDCPTCEMKFDGENLFIILDDVPIAKRGEPGTRNPKKWVPLVHGYRVRDIGSELVVEWEGADTH